MAELYSAPSLLLVYAFDEKEYIIRLQNDLQAQGIHFMADYYEHLPSADDEASLQAAIWDCDSILFMATPGARNSPTVQSALYLAQLYRRPVFPVWVAGAQWDTIVPPGWSGKPHIDARGTRYPAALKTLLQLLLKAPATPPKPPKLRFNFPTVTLNGYANTYPCSISEDPTYPVSTTPTVTSPAMPDAYRAPEQKYRVQQTSSGDAVAEDAQKRPGERSYRGPHPFDTQIRAGINTPHLDEAALHASAPRRLRFLIGLLIMLLLLLASIGATAWFFALRTPGIVTVTTLSDAGPGSLRQAIDNANPGDTIAFAANVRGTILLTVDDLTINKALTIRGPGANMLSISFGTADYGVYISYGNTVTLDDLSFKGSKLVNSTVIVNRGTLTLSSVVISGNSSQRNGGGIGNDGILTLNNSLISGNASSTSSSGIDNNGTATINDSTISGNTTTQGGGGIVNNGTLTLQNSTVSNNTALGGGGIYNTGQLTLINATISDNTAKEGAGGVAMIDGRATIGFCTIYGNHAHDIGGIAIEGSSQVTMEDSIVAGNISNTGPNISGKLITGGYNLIQKSPALHVVDQYQKHSTDFLVDPAAALGIDPTLQNNGGATETLQLLPNSPAIDQIPLSECNLNGTDATSADQRGIKRPQGPRCDIGAYEYVPSQ